MTQKKDSSKLLNIKKTSLYIVVCLFVSNRHQDGSAPLKVLTVDIENEQQIIINGKFLLLKHEKIRPTGVRSSQQT